MLKEELIEIVKNIAEKESKNWVSAKEFTQKTGISLREVLQHFDKWNDFIEAAGLQPLDKKGCPDGEKGYNESFLLEKIKSVAQSLNKNCLSMEEFTQISGISQRPIYRIFGSWENLLQKAGLNKVEKHMSKILDEELFEEYFRIYKELDRLPLYRDLKKSKYSKGSFENRFNGFSEFKKRAILFGISKGILEADIANDSNFNDSKTKKEKGFIYEKLDDRPVLGERIDFRGLRHAPVNELGVVFLFGIIAYELGFEVESVQAGFPDCLAKRKIKGDRWQSVRIEFEYKASNFLLHKHSLDGCDLIICWENDWLNSPIEIISIKEIISKSK